MGSRFIGPIGPNCKNSSQGVALFFASLFLTGLLSEGLGQSIIPPEGWTEIANKPEGIAKQFLSPTGPGLFGANLTISHGKSSEFQKKPIALDSLIRMIVAQQSRLFPQYTVSEKGKKVINGIEGGYIISTYARGRLDLENLQFFFHLNGEIYNVVFTTLAPDFNSLRPVLEKSLNSLTFKKD